MLRISRTLVVGAGGLLGACAGEAGPGSVDRTQANVEVTIAPLGTIEGVDNACYRLSVRNGDNDTVWQQDGVCAGQYGDAAGSLSYVGTCDASEGVEMNTVRLELEELFSAPGTAVDRDSYENPCGHTDNGNNDGAPPCELAIECRENQDVPVDFNLTVLRDASVGFFDIAVTFDDIFCSSKLDTCDEDGQPIELLHNPTTGERSQTAVMALACTSGPGAGGDTALHMTPIVVRCAGQEIRLDPTAGPGNAWTDANPDPNPNDPIWQYAVYRGEEGLDCGGESCQKLYWNVAIGFDPAADCTIFAQATASAADQMLDGLTPAGTTYPIITFGAN